VRTLVFGARGQLGRDFLFVLKDKGEVVGLDLPETNIAHENVASTEIDRFRPDLIINAAAYTDVEAAEDDAEDAFLVNEIGAANVARAASAIDTPIVYLSTDYVFDGTKDSPYTPDDPVNPLNVYARSKVAGEVATRTLAPRHFIVRSAWLFGPGGNNFVEKILRAAAMRPILRVVNDEVGSPTHTWDLVQAILALCHTGSFGTYHAVNAGACSRYEFAREIVRLAGLANEVVPCASGEFPTRAKRPMRSVLDTRTLETTTGIRMRSWQDALRDYMQRRQWV